MISIVPSVTEPGNEGYRRFYSLKFSCVLPDHENIIKKLHILQHKFSRYTVAVITSYSII